uniref:PiggyBac transposable element-derived protein domain-containing protein n=1 Tax=Dicentrarchus labrax TaxID=13489 RepID=A0A8P4JXH0_DICLA
MASKKLTLREVMGLLFADPDPDSEGENPPLGDDDRSISECASRSSGVGENSAGTSGVSVHSFYSAGHGASLDEEVYQEWIKSFDEQVGYRGDRELSTDSRPIDFLSLFLTDDFCHITMETNRYAHQYLGSHELMPSSRFHEWYDVTVPEMKAFLSLHLSMGLVHKSEIEDYWAEFWPTFTPGFGKVMSRNRFEMNLSFFHFANNEEYVERGQPGYDRLFKVRPIIDLIIPRFSAVYGPRKQLSLDEMTIAFKGKCTLKMYNPNKPDKYGYKAFVLSEAKSGYVLQWSLYTGQHGDEVTDLGATHVLVRQLMAQHIGKGHELYMDSYYTSPAVATELANVETGLCGTVSSQRRGMPKALRKTELPLARGDDPVFMRRGKMLACAWHDVKPFHLLSTLHGNSCVRKRIRSKHTDSGFRDRMKTYLFPHRSKKWYNRIVNAILSISMVNAHIIYSSMTAGPHKPLRAFRSYR